MIQTLIIIAAIYLASLVILSLLTRQKEKSTSNYLLAGSKVGSVLGMFTFAATLFSTFTLIGMPDFFRTHGVGSWIFLAFSDTAMVFLIVWLGLYVRKKARVNNFKGMSGLMAQCFQSKFAGYVTFIGAFIFLTPYVSIQIRGIAIFLHATFPEALPVWGWASLMILVMLLYSETGGLKAIIYSDMLQGILLLIVICVIGYNCLSYFGNMEAMFEQVEKTRSELLSVPGPQGLFTPQFLFASFLAIIMIPFTQPQVATRIIIMKDNNSLFRMAIGVGFFAIVIILPTMLIGMYGAVKYPDLSTADFISKVIIDDQTQSIAAFAIIGLIAAAISTSDSQIFALGGELRSLLDGEDKQMLKITRIGIVFFALVALVFSLISSDQLVLLARTSFAGTALMAPMIFTGIFLTNHTGKVMPYATALSMFIFILSLLGVIPSFYFGIRLDLLLFIFVSATGIINALLNKEKEPVYQV
ncbi:MAG: sodium:solute symporter [Thalassobius sp.]|nr:sodium:solute symporter [Thalassovita sp.]